TLAGCHTAPPTVSDNVMACGKIADTAQRYRCYDSLNTSMRPAPSARAANASAPAGAAAVPTAPSQARAHGAAPAPQLQSGAVSAAPPSIAQAAPAPSENQVGEEYLAPT